MEVFVIIFFYLVALLYSVILHEVSHGVAALYLGDHTAKSAGRLTLDPVKHIDFFGSLLLPLLMVVSTGFAFGYAKPVPYNPLNLRWKKWGDVFVAFAGPATNFFLALIASIIASMIAVQASVKESIISAMLTVDWEGLVGLLAGDGGAILYAIMVMMIFWNVLLGVFNLLPIPPLDGSKLLFTLVPVKFEVQMFLEKWGILILLFLLFFFPPFTALFQGILSFFWAIFFSISL